jgi:hypothetical protein
MINTHKFTVELEENFLAQTQINGEKLGAYIEINTSLNILNQRSDIHMEQNGQNLGSTSPIFTIFE